MIQPNISLTAIIIAKNEAARIENCMKALSVAKEIIVIDNDSHDETAEIAQKLGASVLSVKTGDFAKLRNIALAQAKGEWILYVDADETVTPALRSSIVHEIQGTEHQKDAYELFRKNYYLGHLWPRGEWMLRLFQRSKISEWQGKLHESPTVSGETGRLEGELLHDTHRTLEEMVEKTNEWSDIEANLRLAAHHPPITWWRILRMVGTGFWNSFVSQGGWRVGTVGWIESMYQGFSYFITYAKLWEKQQQHVHRK